MGEENQEIAKRLGKANQAITEHLALLDAPECLEQLFASGRCTTAKTFYELRSLYEKFPEPVEAWCADVEEVTRGAVAALAQRLKGQRLDSVASPASQPEFPPGGGNRTRRQAPCPTHSVKQGRDALVLLSRKPSSEGLMHVRFVADDPEAEFSCKDCRIKLLGEW